MKTIELDEAIHVIGIELRTTNEEAFQTIPPHWKRFTEEDVSGRIAGKQSGDVYAVYTHFQNAGRNNQGLYSLVLGVPVDAAATVPQGLTRVVVPASLRAVFPVEKGRFDLVGAKWQEIWQRGDLAKTFIADIERYRPDGEIDILIGIEREAAIA
jgi:predicted transcriptional regulator YdeE